MVLELHTANAGNLFGRACITVFEKKSWFGLLVFSYGRQEVKEYGPSTIQETGIGTHAYEPA
jgi:hypothetical protein